MLKYRTLFLIGVLVIIVPYLGFPDFWRKMILLLTGISIAYIAYLLYKDRRAQSMMINHSNTYTENRNEIKNV